MKYMYIKSSALLFVLALICSSCGNPLATDYREQFLGRYSGQSYEERALAIAPTNDFNFSYPATLEVLPSTVSDDQVNITLEICHSSGEQLNFEFTGTATESNTIVILDKTFLGLLMGDQNTEFTDGLLEFTTSSNTKLTFREVRSNATNNQALDDNDYSSTIEIIFNQKGSGTLNC